MNHTALLIGFILFNGLFSNPISRKEYYPVFKGNSVSQMELLVNQLEKKDSQKAYLGALKMKLANLQKEPRTKLKTFKEGRELLEGEIKKQPNNMEWHFLRLIVQEHAPKIVKYNQNLLQDATFITSNFSSVPLDLQKVISDYASNSVHLNPFDFK